MGPVTELEYTSRKERYDTILVEQLKLSKKQVEQMNINEKIRILYDYRRNEYEKLTDAVYYRRGWTPNGIPTPQKMKQLGFTNKKMLTMLQNKIDTDEKEGRNTWGGTYNKKENPPTKKSWYWEHWK